MKFLSGHLAYALRDEQLQRNVGGLLKYLAFLVLVVTMYSVLFHFIMLHAEGREHSWVTGVYWTLTVMSTLGFGDITFTSDVGRAFSVVVLLSGIVLLLIVLPFAFIRYFYAPWLEARLRVRAPTEVPSDVTGHVVFTHWDPVAQGLSERLEGAGIPWFIVVEDSSTATAMHEQGLPVVRGAVDDAATYRGAGVDRARLVLASGDDRTNTNVVLTAREVSEAVPVVALAEDQHSVDILEMSGCDRVFLLKRRLGEQLANRIRAGHAEAHVIGRYRNLVIAEFSVHATPLAGKTLAETRIREIAGASVVGVWERGRMMAPSADLLLTETSLPVVTGSEEAIERLNEFLFIYDTNPNPVVVIGGGKVGRAATQALKERSVPVHMVEQNAGLTERIGDLPDRLVIGDAADRRVMERVGVEVAPSILLSTNDDATNIYLSSYCRRLSPGAQIVSRITHDRNLTAIQRAGADLTLSYATLGVETLVALLHDRPPLILGEGVAFHEIPCPPALEGLTLREARIGQRTGLTVVGLEGKGGEVVPDPGPETPLGRDAVLLAIGTREQVDRLKTVVQ